MGCRPHSPKAVFSDRWQAAPATLQHMSGFWDVQTYTRRVRFSGAARPGFVPAPRYWWGSTGLAAGLISGTGQSLTVCGTMVRGFLVSGMYFFGSGPALLTPDLRWCDSAQHGECLGWAPSPNGTHRSQKQLRRGPKPPSSYFAFRSGMTLLLVRSVLKASPEVIQTSSTEQTTGGIRQRSESTRTIMGSRPTGSTTAGLHCPMGPRPQAMAGSSIRLLTV
jgi:hypothetical protein